MPINPAFRASITDPSSPNIPRMLTLADCEIGDLVMPVSGAVTRIYLVIETGLKGKGIVSINTNEPRIERAEFDTAVIKIEAKPIFKVDFSSAVFREYDATSVVGSIEVSARGQSLIATQNSGQPFTQPTPIDLETARHARFGAGIRFMRWNLFLKPDDMVEQHVFAANINTVD